MANLKLILRNWGVEIHTRKDEKDSYKQTGAALESENGSGFVALEHYLGRKFTEQERRSIEACGFYEL